MGPFRFQSHSQEIKILSEPDFTLANLLHPIPNLSDLMSRSYALLFGTRVPTAASCGSYLNRQQAGGYACSHLSYSNLDAEFHMDFLLADYPQHYLLCDVKMNFSVQSTPIIIK